MKRDDVRRTGGLRIAEALCVTGLLTFSPLALAQSSAPAETKAETMAADAKETATEAANDAEAAVQETAEDAAQTAAEAPAPASTGPTRRGAEAAVENITITGTKKARGQVATEAPVALTALGEDQLDALQFRDLESLTFSIPNVSLDAVGTAKGVANFSIRGLGANSSIPTIDPTVGIFINGVYLGSNAGAVLDSFDLEAVEVLRGPQGILFGRNVTGGAVLLRTKRPGDTYSASVKTNVEINGAEPDKGLEYRFYGGVDLPLVEDLFKARISGQFRRDDGWFTNLAPVNGDPTNLEEQQFGEETTWLIRPTITFTPTEDITLHVMYEHGDTDAAGPASQSTNRVGSLGEQVNPGFIGPFGDFDFSIDEPGFAKITWDQIFAELIIDLGDNGTLTDVFGYRRVDNEALSDIDAQPISIFHADSLTKIEHWSNELRYTNDFGRVEATVGLYVFGQTIRYRENRLLFEDIPTASPTGFNFDSTFGGDQDQLSVGAFTQLEFKLTDKVTAIAGGRYTWERKEADVVTFTAFATSSDGAPSPPFLPPGSPCAGTLSLDCPFDGEGAFNDEETWQNFSPKLGAQIELNPTNRIYGHWTRGFRSGGYNMRNTSSDPASVPGPFDEEQQDVFELGVKSAIADRKIRFNAAVFMTEMRDMQREVNIPGDAGVVQIIRNTADASVFGFEVDTTISIIPNLVLLGSLGYTDGDYRDVRFDLNGDGTVGIGTLGNDNDLTLPRLATITANAGFIFDIDLGSLGFITMRGNYAYRDESFFTDNNFGLLPSGHVIDASISFTASDIGINESKVMVPKFTIYGRNLANETFLGGQTPLSFGGNFSPLKEGRVLGAELRIDFL